ncbi:MAG: translocation/assembly module TamB domain-containing protein [Adhaeribacter sp.]
MENQNNRLQAVGKFFLKFIFGLILFFLLLAGIILIAIRIPAVQTAAVHKASGILSEKLQHEVSIERVDIAFFNRVILDKVKVLDYKNEVLFYVGQLHADISFFDIFHPDQLHISTLTLEKPQANLVRYKNNDSFNLSSFLKAIQNLTVKKDTTTTKKPFEFKIDAIAIKNGRFTYYDQNKTFAPDSNAVDYKYLIADSISGRFSEIELGDTLRVKIDKLKTTETRSKTRLHELSTRMVFAPTFWEFNDVLLSLGQSNLREYIRFDYKRFGNFTQFNDSVTVTANLKKAKVYTKDIARFAPQFKDINDSILITGELAGKLKRFRANKLDVFYGRNTHIVGNLSASGLPNIREAFIEMQLKPSVLNARDLQKYIPKKSFAIAQRLGTVKLTGNFLGFYNDFVANGSFQTALGNVVSDINLKINPKTQNSSYSGYLRTANFNVGKLIGNSKIISNIALDGRVKGVGFDINTARVQLDANINTVNLYGYNYRNIKTNATLSRQQFSGDFTIRDPNINLTATGDVNLNQQSPSFDLVADIQHLNFKALKLTNENISLQTKATVDFSGLKLDNITGRAYFANTILTLNNYVVPTDSVVFISALENNQRSLQILSDVANVNATGTWDYTVLLRDLRTLIHEYRLNFESNTPVTAAYYRNKKRTTLPEYEINYKLSLIDFNGIIKAFVPILGISDNSVIEGSFRQGSNAIFGVYAHTDTLYYGKNQFLLNDLELNTSKLPYSPDVLANVIINSQRQILKPGGDTENLYLEGVWSERAIQFTTNIAQVNSTNQANISGNLTFLNNKLQIVFNTSNVNVLGKAWHITPNNTIEISGLGKEINFEDVVISHENQRISVAGMLSQNPEKSLEVKIDNFRLENLNPLFTSKFKGILNAQLSARDVYRQAIITSELTADSVYMNEYFVGRVAGTSNWDNPGKRLAVDLGITRENLKVLNVTGYYNPGDENNQIDLLAIMDDAPVKLVEPLLNTLFSNLSGTMDGRLQMTGQLTAPNLSGSALVSNGRFTFNYLNTTYTFSDRIYFTQNDITFRDVKLYDPLNNVGTVSGSIIHQGFKNIILDLRGEFRRFMVLNTTREQNQLYYGTAIATGSATVLGAPSNLQMNIDARSEAGTRLSIPLDNSSTVTRQNFIRFVNRNIPDSTLAVPISASNQADLSGINMNFNLQITPDAYMEIILDQTSGDMVRGSGNGRIRMNIDTRGEFTMDGQVEITRGAYNFTLYNIINKEFTIRPGGTITWNGDPYAGIMNITATYTQNVTIPQSLANNDETLSNVRIPVTAVMNLAGNLLTPEIRLDLEFQNAPNDVETQLARVLADLRNDQDELNRQVFSLLILKRLSDRNNFGSTAVEAGITGSLSELVTNQLGNFLSQVDSNLEVDIGINSSDPNASALDQVALRNLQVRLSYSLFEGRLRVTREGGLNNGNYNNQTSSDFYGTTNTLAGDWRVEYYLGQNGKLRLRLEYITSQRRFASTTNTATTNVSVLHTEQFNRFSELFARKRVRRRYLQQDRERVILDSDVRYDDIK